MNRTTLPRYKSVVSLNFVSVSMRFTEPRAFDLRCVNPMETDTE